MQGKAKPETWTSERCFVSEWLNEAAYPEVSVARCRMEPGVTTQKHSLSVHEVYVVESGNGLMMLGDEEPFEVGPGGVVTIPKHTAQSIRNIGDGDLSFLCICTPRFLQECYTSLE
ncbi:MAG: cupin domain-containing protein [Woeseiaceae bacterium]|nr:cupin domain-containing protein [Woeseiaceae bacterium]